MLPPQDDLSFSWNIWNKLKCDVRQKPNLAAAKRIKIMDLINFAPQRTKWSHCVACHKPFDSITHLKYRQLHSLFNNMFNLITTKTSSYVSLTLFMGAQWLPHAKIQSCRKRPYVMTSAYHLRSLSTIPPHSCDSWKWDIYVDQLMF